MPKHGYRRDRTRYETENGRVILQADPIKNGGITQGRAVEHDALVSNLRTAADESNIVANIFPLKARHQYRGGEALEANLNVNLNTVGVIVAPPRMSIDDFLEGLEMRDVTPD